MPGMIENVAVFSLLEAAHLLQLSTLTTRLYTRQGRLRTIKVGASVLVSAAALEECILSRGMKVPEELAAWRRREEQPHILTKPEQDILSQSIGALERGAYKMGADTEELAKKARGILDSYRQKTWKYP